MYGQLKALAQFGNTFRYAGTGPIEGITDHADPVLFSRIQ
jgi:hypothetical protein